MGEDLDRNSLRVEKEFYRDEYTDRFVYEALVKGEGHRGLRELMGELAAKEDSHMRIWKGLVERRGARASPPHFTWLRAMGFRAVRILFGIAFLTKLLERNEVKGIEEYSKVISSARISKRTRETAKMIIKDEKVHEARLLKRVEANEGSLSYVKSIIFGLNDGLVEVFAAVAGFAALTNTNVIVVLGGIIVGISGTLSMAGGAYLASKSQNIVEIAIERKDGAKMASPAKDAYYTGVFYFIGAVVPILPFIFGAGSYFGILLAALLDIIVLVIASVVIAVISNTSIKRRTVEMLAISIGAAIVTIIIGTVARIYFGISV